MKYIIPLHIVLILFCCSLAAQQMKFKPLTTKEGLSNNSVNDMISDADGRLWIATWDGLNVYDGTTVTVFKHRHDDVNSVSGNAVLHLQKDAADRIWVLTDNETVSEYLGDGIFKQYHVEEAPTGLRLTKDGYIAVTFEDGVQALVQQQFQPINKGQLKAEDDLGVLQHFLLQQYPDLIINDIFKDTEGNIWYATRRNGLYIIPNTPQNVNNQLIEHYTYDLYSPYSFTSNEIEKIYQDDFGNIWLAHKDGGVSMAYNGAEQITTIIPHPIKFPHLPNETIRAITKDKHSTIWLGYYTNGLFYYSETTHCFLPFDIKEADQNPDWNRIRSLYTDTQGAVWVGTYAGVVKITNGTYRLFTSETQTYFPNHRNYAFYETNSHLWVACWGGLGKLNTRTQTFETFPHQKELEAYHIRHVIAEGDTLVLATEENGVLFFTEEEGIIQQLTVANGLLGNSIYRLLFDAQTGYYWIATLGGVTVYDPAKGVVKNLTETDGLPSHMVYGLLSDGTKIWISTTKGIATIDKENYHVFQLPKDQGWQAEEFSEGASYQDMKGMLFFGGINGFSYFQPAAYHYALKPPKLHVQIDGKEKYPSLLEKSYGNNSLAVQITPVSFSGVTPTIYYQLEGFDDDWKPYNNQEILYNNLNAGTYTLHTRVAGDTQLPIEQLQLTIATPFYQTSWFFLLCLVFVVLLVGAIIIRKNVATKRIQRTLEAKIQERTATIAAQKTALENSNEALEARHAELNAQKEQVLALHHQLKNRDFEVDKFKTFVLSAFQPKLSKMVQTLSGFPETPEKQQLSHMLLGMIQHLSEWDYLDQIESLGAVASSQIHFKKLMERIYAQLQPESMNGTASFSYHIATETAMIATDVLRMKLLFQYLLNDIMKYNHTSDTLTMECTLHQNHMNITIHSNSALLMEQWENMTLYSPYYKGFETLLADLGGSITTENHPFEAEIHIPIENVQHASEHSGVLLLKHLEDTEAQMRPTILVYCDADEMEAVHHLLQETQYQLLFEHNAQALPSALQQINVKALVVYNAMFTSAFIQVLHQPAFQQLPSIYIAEHINLEMEEKVMDYGMNSILYLPVSSTFLQKKLHALLQQQQKPFALEGVATILATAESISQPNTPHEKLVKQALELIKTELGNADFNVDRLITEMDISRTKCYRVFKEVLQQSPSDVISNLRLQKAEQLLLSGSLNISEISFECGFNDPKYFSRQFKKYFGASPKSYQKKQQEGAGV